MSAPYQNNFIFVNVIIICKYIYMVTYIYIQAIYKRNLDTFSYTLVKLCPMAWFIPTRTKQVYIIALVYIVSIYIYKRAIPCVYIIYICMPIYYQIHTYTIYIYSDRKINLCRLVVNVAITLHAVIALMEMIRGTNTMLP